MELFRSGACFGRTDVFWGLCERDCMHQSLWCMADSRCFVGTGRLVCVGMQEVQGIVLIWKLAWTFETFGVQQVANCRQYKNWGENLSENKNQCKSGCDAPGRKEFAMIENQLAEVVVENGITYHLAEDGCYYPQLSLEQKTDYMMEYQRHEYLKMVMDGTWNQYLHNVDEECHREVELAVKRLIEKEGVTEQLKKENPKEWVQRVNGIKVRTEEQIVKKLLPQN